MVRVQKVLLGRKILIQSLREALIPIREPWNPNVRPVSVRPSEILVIFAKGTSVSEWVRSASGKIENRVREKRDFCEGTSVSDRVRSASTIFQKSNQGTEKKPSQIEICE